MAKLLVVDDEEKIREMIKRYARFEGYEVEESSDGFDAVERCEREDFDLIIMDVMMPDLDGFSAVKAIRRFKNTPVIMLSARHRPFGQPREMGQGRCAPPQRLAHGARRSGGLAFPSRLGTVYRCGHPRPVGTTGTPGLHPLG